ncbi:hypothetical protein L7F22_028581 [Adiantum nelumboides]|nr:hypothetical protein [Adiantum nelumboides]
MTPFVIEASEVQSMLASQAGLSMEDLLSDLVGAAKRLARPPISRFYVGAVGLGISGRIFLGVNLEFEGLPLNNTVHAEQFLVTNAAQHGEQALQIIAVSAAPCGHCRQFLQELRGAPDLRILIVDAAAETRTLAHFLPHRFGPNDVLSGDFPLLLEPRQNGLSLKVTHSVDNLTIASQNMSHYLHGRETSALDAALEDAKSSINCTAIYAKDNELVCNLTARLKAAAFEAANKSHAPYTNSPSGVALLTKSRQIFCGSYMESVAYNPSLPPLQSALVAFVARDGGSYDDIVQTVLVEREGAPIQFMDTAKLLLQKISQDCKIHVYYTS